VTLTRTNVGYLSKKRIVKGLIINNLLEFFRPTNIANSIPAAASAYTIKRALSIRGTGVGR